MSAADRLAAELESAAFDRIKAFIALRGRWDRTHDLIGPASRADPWGLDVVDGVAVADLLGPDGGALVDVGSGGGVPGLVVACLLNHPVVLVEPRTKRAAFLRAAKSALKLGHVRVIRGRWPDVAGTAGSRLQVVSRAVVNPTEWPALAASGGRPVETVFRLLASERPDWGPAEFRLDAARDYGSSAGERRVERWIRSR